MSKNKKDFIKLIEKSCHKDMKYDDLKSKISFDNASKQTNKSTKRIAILSTCFSLVAVCLIMVPTLIHFTVNSNSNGNTSNQVPNMPDNSVPDTENDNDTNQSNPENDGPAISKEVNFNNTYVQTYSYTWPIALSSYALDNNFIEINGKFIIPNHVKITNFEKFKVSFNENNFAYIISYDPSPDPQGLVYASNFQWNLNDLKSDNSCNFTLLIDILPLIENDKLLGELVIDGDFFVFHDFNGKPIQ